MPNATAHNRIVLRYGGAVLVVVAATLLSWLLHDLRGADVIFVPYYLAVALVAMFAGGRSGILATTLSTLIVVGWFSFGRSSSGEAVSVTVFIAASLIVSTTAEMLRRSQLHEAELIGERLVEQELELAEQDERYRLLAEHAEDFVSLSDEEGQRLYVSPSYYRRTGWTPEEVRNNDWRTRIHSEDHALVERTRVANLAGQTTSIEYRVLCRDGSSIWVEGRCKPITDAAGKVRRMVLWSHDITDRKAAERTLRESEERMRLVLQASEIGTFEVDLMSGEETWNTVEFELLGLKPNEADGHPETFLRFVHPDDNEWVRGKWEEAKRTGEFDQEFRIVRADGQERWLAGKGRIVDAGSKDQRQVRFLGVNFDITDRKRAEQAMRASDQRIRAILNTASDAIITIDEQGMIAGTNPATERMFGYSAEELVGQIIWVLISPPSLGEQDSALRHDRETESAGMKGIGREAIGCRKDGSTFPVDLAVSELDHCGFTGIIRDISEHKALQKQVLEISVEEQRRIGQELHDGTQQELTGLTLVAGTLLDILNAAPAKQANGDNVWVLDQPSYQQLCDIARRLSQRLAEANRHVQQLAHGIMPVQIDAEGLRSALNELATATNELNEIACRFDSSGSVAVANNTTATHLFRIAQEAVTNALRHGHADHILISLVHSSGQLVLEVRDNGTGFNVAATPRGARINGTQGMGLRIMEYRAGMIGGSLSVECAATCGTTVRCAILQGGGTQ